MSLARSASATVTATTGPGQAMTAVPLTDVKSLVVDFEHSTVSLNCGDPVRTVTVEGANLATITVTVAGVIVVST